MQAADFTLILNLGFVALLAVSYLATALLNPGHRAPLWLAASYAVGMLAPLSALVGIYAGSAPPYPFLAYGSFVAAVLLMLVAIAAFYHRPPPWRLVAVLAAYAVLILPELHALPRNSTLFVLLSQSPYMLVMLACVGVIARASPRRPSDLLLLGLYAVIALHFPAKALLAAYLGTGGTAQTYAVNSPFALLAQVSSGILFMAVGLVLLIKLLQNVILEKQADAETDPLSGVANRRGFEMGAERMLAEAAVQRRPVSLLLLDLDHFKAVNDTHGHGAGDAAIRAFGDMLRRTAPQSALPARIGGEEFAVLLDRTGLEAALLHAETLRLAAACAEDGAPPVTVSIGVAEIGPPYELKDAIARADAALYAAKSGGRNRVCCAPPHRLRAV